jgi:hypothetical protein
MKKSSIFLIIFILGIGMIGCSSKDVRKPPSMVVRSCSLHPIEGECRVFTDRTLSCSQGKCLNGDCSTGIGKLEYPGGSIQEGSFKDNLLNGKGSYINCENRIKFDGTLKNGYAENGTFIYSDGTIYSGTVKKGIYDGKGKFTAYDGTTYEGVWKNGMKNGPFVLTGTITGKITYIDNIDKEIIEAEKKREKEIIEAEKRRQKEIIDQETRDRKYKAIQEAEEREEYRKQELREEQYRRVQYASQQKYEAERKKAYQDCQATRSEYSPQCKNYNRNYER